MESQEAEQQNRRSLEEIDVLNFNNTRLTKRVEGLMERCLASGCMRPDAHARSHAWTERLDRTVGDFRSRQGSAFGRLDRTRSEEVEQLKKKGGQAWFGGWSGKQTELTKV